MCSVCPYRRHTQVYVSVKSKCEKVFACVVVWAGSALFFKSQICFDGMIAFECHVMPVDHLFSAMHAHAYKI
jgi:hypothetical protein